MGITDDAGRLEINRNGQWGPICSDSFTDVDAEVACRELGMTGGTVLSSTPASAGTPATLVECRGGELQLSECSLATTRTCTQSDVTIACDFVRNPGLVIEPSAFTATSLPLVLVLGAHDSFVHGSPFQVSIICDTVAPTVSPTTSAPLPAPTHSPHSPFSVSAPLVCGAVTTGVSTTSYETVYYSLHLDLNGLSFTFETTGITDFDTVITLYDASQRQLDTDDEGGVGHLSRLTRTLPSGSYFVGVSGFEGRHGTSYLNTSCRCDRAAVSQPAICGSTFLVDTADGTQCEGISSPFENMYSLTLPNRSQVTATLHGDLESSNLSSASLRLYHADAAFHTLTLAESELGFAIPLSRGTYVLGVGFDDGSVGNVTVALGCSTVPPTPSPTRSPVENLHNVSVDDLSCGSTVTGELSSSSLLPPWIASSPGDVYTIEVHVVGHYVIQTCNNSFDTVLVLIDAGSTRVAINDDGGTCGVGPENGHASEIRQELGVGVYYIAVYPYDSSDTTGSFQLSLQCPPGSNPGSGDGSVGSSTSTMSPSASPAVSLTGEPTGNLAANPTANPTTPPVTGLTANPTANPAANPTANPTADPAATPITSPSATPSSNQIADLTANPITSPTVVPMVSPTGSPVDNSIDEPPTNSAPTATSNSVTKKPDPDKSSGSDTGDGARLGLYVGILVAALFVVVVSVVLFVARRRRKIPDAGTIMNPASTEMDVYPSPWPGDESRQSSDVDNNFGGGTGVLRFASDTSEGPWMPSSATNGPSRFLKYGKSRGEAALRQGSIEPMISESDWLPNFPFAGSVSPVGTGGGSVTTSALTATALTATTGRTATATNKAAGDPTVSMFVSNPAYDVSEAYEQEYIWDPGTIVAMPRSNHRDDGADDGGYMEVEVEVEGTSSELEMAATFSSNSVRLESLVSVSHL